MKMNMINTLTAVFVAVHHHSIAIGGYAMLFSKLTGGIHDFA
jgi:hypothetical protein